MRGAWIAGAILIACCALADSQPAVNASQQAPPIKEKSGGVSDQQKATESSPKIVTPKPVAPISRGDEVQPNQKTAIKAQSAGDNTEKSWFDKVRADPNIQFNGLLVLFTSFLAISSICQGRLTKRSVDAQVNAARPIIIYLTHGSLEIEGMGTTYFLHFENCGKSHAFIKREWWAGGEFPDSPPIPADGPPKGSPRKLAWGAAVRPEEVWPAKGYDYVGRRIWFNLEQRERVKQGCQDFYVFGEIIYNDGFGPERKTWFCRRYHGDGFTLDQLTDPRLNGMT